MKDIKNYDTFMKIECINKGWSNDKKYYVETKNGEKLLLRISDISEYGNKKHEFDIIKKIAKVGINMSLPIDFGICNNGKSVYQILSWCDGIEAKEILPTLSEKEQYEFGLKAGKMLKEMQKVENYSPSNECAEITEVIEGLNLKVKSKDGKDYYNYIKKNTELVGMQKICFERLFAY